MINFDKGQPVSGEIAENIASEQANSDKKPDFVKKIEAFDIKHLTPENIQFMTEVIQNFYRKTFPIKKPDLIDEMPKKMVILNEEEFNEVLYSDEDEDLDDDFAKTTTGFHSMADDKIYICASRHNTAGELFATMFHEGLHFTSIGSEAGLSGNGFLTPMKPRHAEGEDIWDNPMRIERTEEEKAEAALIKKGMTTLCEGTTQLITLTSVVSTMGFDETPGMTGYFAEWNIMNAIWGLYSGKEVFHVYFGMSMDDLRIRVEKALQGDESRIAIGPNVTNGEFVKCLAKLGEITDKVEEDVKNWRKTGKSKNILDDVRRATGYFYLQDAEANGVSVSKDFLDEYSVYFESFVREEENV